MSELRDIAPGTSATEADILIAGGRIVDPAADRDEVGDLWIRDGRVAEITPARTPPSGRRGLLVLDARGLVVCPGLVDVHCHLRDPGQEEKETIATGTRAAARGGYTTVCSMANTNPVVDSRAVVEYIQRQARATGVVNVRPLATVTRSMAGKELVEMADLAEAGAVAFSDDGRPILDSGVMRHALEYSRLIGRPIMVHEEDLTLSAGGVMNEGPVATRLGLKGWPGVAEEVMIARDLALCELTGGRLHLAHVTTARGVEIIRQARERGVRFTAETTPHHLTLTDDWVAGWRPDGKTGAPYDTATKVNPPLRSERDREALIEAIRDGTLDLIGTDHAPHSEVDKLCEYGAAAFGISGLETSLSALLGLVHAGQLDLALLLRRLTCDPARAFDLPGGTFATGAPADVCVFDPDSDWTVDPAEFASLGRNTPLAGQTLRGQVFGTVCGGQLVYQNARWRTSERAEGASS
jgi:dihydroorotase